EESSSAIHWLSDQFNLQINKISQLGGHSHPRTHRFPEGPVGNKIVTGIHNYIEKNLLNNNNIQFCYNCNIKDLLFDEESKTIIGVSYIKNNTLLTQLGSAIILACGGFSNDHTENSLLNKYSLDKEYLLPTTNGP